MTHGKNKRNFSISSAEEFIAAITQHIPDQNFQLVRYYGWYSNRMRGERRKMALEEEDDDTENDIINVASYKPRKILPPTWSECIKKIWEVDPLKCPHCSAEMKIISFIKEQQVIRKILEHLNLWDRPERCRPPPRAGPVPQATLRHEEERTQHDPFDDGWPGYEEPCSTCD